MFLESEPLCRTNISLPGNALDMSDHVEIECSVVYNGIWSPVFICADHLPGTTINQTSSDHVLYTRLIAAANIEDFTQLSCSMSFTLTAHYQSISPELPSEPTKPVYDFAWNTSAIRVVNATGKYTQVHKLAHSMFKLQLQYYGLYCHAYKDISLLMTYTVHRTLLPVRALLTLASHSGTAW